MKKMLENLYLNMMIFADTLKDSLYMLFWLCGGLYWRAWQAYDRKQYHKNIRHNKKATVSITDSDLQNKTPKANIYHIALTSNGEKMLNDITEAHSMYHNKTHTKSQLIAAIINLHIEQEHKKALELREKAIQKRRDNLKVVQ